MRELWFGFVCAVVVLVVAQSALAAATSVPPSDDKIYDEVRLRLASDAQVKGGALEVEVKDGVVTLMGKVKTEKQKSRAERLARKVRGVKKVINKLVVEPTG